MDITAQGPVIPKISHTYKQYQTRPIPKEAANLVIFNQTQKLILTSIRNVYGAMDLPKLLDQALADFGPAQSDPGLLKPIFRTNSIVQQLQSVNTQSKV